MHARIRRIWSAVAVAVLATVSFAAGALVNGSWGP
jgi:hypothetical protein